jgi:hypothetical protein
MKNQTKSLISLSRQNIDEEYKEDKKKFIAFTTKTGTRMPRS